MMIIAELGTNIIFSLRWFGLKLRINTLTTWTLTWGYIISEIIKVTVCYCAKFSVLIWI